MPSRKPHDSIENKGLDNASAMPKETVAHSSQVSTRVENIASILMLMGMFLICWALLLLLLPLYIVLAPNGKVTDSVLPTVLVPGLMALSIGVFILKVRADFRRFKSWTYSWVNLLTKTSWGCLFKKDLHNEEVRRAFNQPEFEYPKYPEYGYKLEEKKKDRK